MFAFLLKPWLISLVLSIAHIFLQAFLVYQRQIPMLDDLKERFDGTTDRFRQLKAIYDVRRRGFFGRLAQLVLSLVYLFFRNPIIEGLFLLIPLVLLCLGVADLAIYTRVTRIGSRQLLKPALVSIVFEAAYAGLYYALFIVMFPAGLQPLRDLVLGLLHR